MVVVVVAVLVLVRIRLMELCLFAGCSRLPIAEMKKVANLANGRVTRHHPEEGRSGK